MKKQLFVRTREQMFIRMQFLINTFAAAVEQASFGENEKG